MKVALFGGAFDPPHLGHQQIAQKMIEHSIVDEVWYIPVYTHPWADRLGKWQMAAYEHRKKMVELILTPGTKLMEYQDVSFTYPTLVEFAKNYPEHDFSWVIGADNLPTFGDWDFYQQIISEFGVHVYPRRGFILEQLFEGMNLLTDFPEVVASSTLVREALNKGESISELVDLKVEQYIEENKLYQ